MTNFPKSHVVLACVLALPLTSLLLASVQSTTEEERFSTDLVLAELEPVAQPAAESLAIPKPGFELSESLEKPTPLPVPVTLPSIPEEPPAPPRKDLITLTEEVRPGDSLARIFQRQKIPPRELQAVLDSGPTAARLKRIYPGHELTFLVTPDRSLVSVSYTPGPLETLVFERQGDVFSAKHVTREPERVTAYRHARIDHSLFVASQRIGLDDDITLRLAQIFQWDIDFVLDIRKGDEFYVLFEEKYLDEEFIGFGDILAAEFVNQGERHQAIRYVDADGDADYFNPTGDSMRKAFLRAPVEFTRISSNFNLKRFHPIRKTVVPHRGIDYAAPTGTPILAAGDGRIVKATRNKASGNYVVIQHGEQFQTKYLHMSKFGRGIRGGAKVKQSQIIGYVGATGWATGPHLHYEFLVNGVHRNPRTVPMPKAKPIAPSERPRFEAHASPLLAMLDSYRQQVQIAATDQ